MPTTAVNYGGIGAVIGHEIWSRVLTTKAHATTATATSATGGPTKIANSFEALTGKLVDQYSQFEPLPGMNVDGRVSLGENIGDHVGLLSAFRALPEIARRPAFTSHGRLHRRTALLHQLGANLEN